MKKESYYSIVTAIFVIIFVAHALRIINGWPAAIGGLEIPLWVSWLAAGLSGVLAYFGFKLKSER